MTKVSSAGILLTNPDDMLMMQCKYHCWVQNPSPHVFGQSLGPSQTFLEVQESHCILLCLFPVCLPLPSWVLARTESHQGVAIRVEPAAHQNDTLVVAGCVCLRSPGEQSGGRHPAQAAGPAWRKSPMPPPMLRFVTQMGLSSLRCESLTGPETCPCTGQSRSDARS